MTDIQSNTEPFAAHAIRRRDRVVATTTLINLEVDPIIIVQPGDVGKVVSVDPQSGEILARFGGDDVLIDPEHAATLTRKPGLISRLTAKLS